MKEGTNIKRRKFLTALSVLTLIAVLVRCALYSGLTIKKYTISSDKITQSHIFAVISDLHCTYYGENQEDLIAKIDQYAPEAIFLTGDIAEDVRPIDGCDALMNHIADRYPCYYVTGNHERWSAAADDMKAVFQAYGAVVLDGTSIDAVFGEDTIRIHGVSDPLYYSSYAAFESAVSALEVSDNLFDILLSHRPECAELYAACGFDLTLNGHAHGGQVRIPFIMNGLYAPNQGWFPKLAGGHYEFGETDIIVSRGLMIDDIPRIFNPPELVIITLTPTD